LYTSVAVKRSVLTPFPRQHTAVDNTHMYILDYFGTAIKLHKQNVSDG